MITKQQIFIIIGVAVLIVVLIIMLFLSTARKTKKQPSFASTPSITIPTTVTGGRVSPTFTGVRDVPPPDDQITLVAQKAALLDKVPLQQSGFTITFDYTIGQFIVTLTEPKAQNRDAFNAWLKSNYPAIPLDRFNFR